MAKREECLGFLPQKEIIYNKFLPYADQLDSESQIYLTQIKTNLGKAILYHNFSDFAFWSSHLTKYIKLYGLKFSKEDHLNFIKIFLELILIPDIELNFVLRTCIELTSLLKKIELLSRDDLIIPWRPLYDMYERIVYTYNDSLGVTSIPGGMEKSLKGLIRVCRHYFSLESTQELLDELRPLICPFDESMNKAVSYFELFLCTKLPPSEHHRGFKLWFDEFMGFWEFCHNNASWENNLLWLFSRLGKDNIGYIYWEPHIPFIFTKLLRSFNLPGKASVVQASRILSTFDTTPICTLIVSMLGAGNSCQDHLDRLFKALESYYHPSNVGKFLIKLQKFLHLLPLSMARRLHVERYKKPSWMTPCPKEYKITDDDVTQFVKSVLPVALLSMFSKCGCTYSAAALNNLALMCPELTIPPTLERLYSSLETLTEPHRLSSSLFCAVWIAQCVVKEQKNFSDGPSHVIPLLMASLPGIDPNDIRKCMVTFQFISTFTTLILLVDCSGAVSYATDLTEKERELCLATVAFEDFVLQFMDRCFSLIENSSLDDPSHLDRDTQKTNLEESILELGMYTTFSAILTQSSPSIYDAALKKLQAFVSSHILEIKIAGKYAANLCRCASRVDPELALKVFVPYCTKLVLVLTDNDNAEENLDDELLFSLLLLSEVVRCNGYYLLKYQKDLISVLHRTLHLKNKEGYTLACSLLKNILKSYTLLYPLDTCSIIDPWNHFGENEQHLYIKEWGKLGDIDNLSVKFHTISDEECAAAQELLEIFLVAELQNLRSWASGEGSLSRMEVHNSLNVVLDCLLGAANALPLWPGEHLNLRESSVPTYCISVSECGSKVVTVNENKNVRELIYEVLQEVLDHIIGNHEDAISLNLVIKLHSALMFYWGITKHEVETKWKAFRMNKRAFENKLNGKKKHIRALLIERAFLQDELRTTVKNKSVFTKTHSLLMKNLLRLSLSHYSDIRIQAQAVLQYCLSTFPSCYRVILPEIYEALQKDPTAFHEEFKGVLHVILGEKQNSLLVVNNWEMSKELWPLIVSSKHSEKPSIIKLLDCISTTIQKHLFSSQIKLEVPKSCIDAAKLLWEDHAPLPTSPCLSDECIATAADALVLWGETNERNYHHLVNTLIEQITNHKLHWRHYHLALAMLMMLIRRDVILPKEAVQIFVNHLKHETLAVRKLSVNAASAILQQQKRKHKKIEIDPASLVNHDVNMHPLLDQVGFKSVPKTFWLQYNSLSPPNTEELWNSFPFVHKVHVGFYAFPKNFKIYAPYTDQPKVDRKREELTEEEKPFFDSFSQQPYVDALMSYFSLEERKGHDKFDAKRFYLFKNLFRNFGDAFLPLFLPHLKIMTEDKQESLQRCASEVVGGLIRGSNHWSFAQNKNLQEQLTPILKSAINNVTPETLSDWATCFSSSTESRDANKLCWVFELFMEEPSKVESGSFLESSWIYLLHHVLTHQEWRIWELLHRLLQYLIPKLNHSYQNVRERIGCLLSDIFFYDVPLATDSLTFAPVRNTLIDIVLPMLTPLANTENGFIKSLNDNNIEDHKNSEIIDTEESEEKKNAMNIFRTICRWLMINVCRTFYSAPPETFKLLPLLCLMQNDTADEGLQKECTLTVAVLGQASLNCESIDAAVNILKTIAEHSSWRSRASAVSFLQVMVFSNLFTVIQRSTWVKSICDMVLKLLEDERVEVREAAAETLGGFLHCEFLKISDELLMMFKQKANRIKRVSNINKSSRSIEPDELKERHAGILGLCACVNAFPYDVPEFLPDILMDLGDHLHDPQPIETTIKKTLSSFRRTHYDNWRDHRLKFTDDQLAVITDLLVSPNYYA